MDHGGRKNHLNQTDIITLKKLRIMRPKKAKELIIPCAERLSLPVKMVEDIVTFYWREVWMSLTNAEGIKVHITNLGDFNIKHWLLEKEMNKLRNFESSTRLAGSQRYNAGIKIADKLTILENLQHMLSEEAQRKEFIYEHKKVVSDAKANKFSGSLEA